MLSNNPEGLWVNGSLGTITEAAEGEVQVDLDRGGVVSVYTTRFELLKGDGSVATAFEQLPFQLGYAITIHKSQGLTLDKVVIDMDNHFSDGMTYVAMSRCRSKEGMFLTGDIGNK
jgi:ATP-dependent exoDNAse (exonuclease V) alpha subunit